MTGEASLRAALETQERDRALFDAAPHGIVFQDAEGRVVSANPAAQRILGLTLDQLQGRKSVDPRWQAIHEDGSPFPGDTHPAMVALRTGEPAGAILGVHNPRREATAWISVEATPLFRPGEPVPFQACACFTDITQRKAAERALLESEERFRTVFEASPDAVLIRQGDGCFLEVNQVAAERYGYTREELLRMRPEDLVPPILKEVVADRIRLCLQTGLPADWMHQKKDGTRVPVELLIREFSMRGKRFTYASARDISERKRAEEETAQLQAQLQQAQKLESLGSLAGGVAHDMNNVLGAILAMATVHQRKAAEGSPLQRDMGTIIRACQRGGNMAKGLLGFARDRLTDERPVDLNVVVQEALSLLSRTTLEKVQLKTDLAVPACFVQGDPAALSHAVLNLCINAVDALPEQGTLTIRTRREGGLAILEVADTGTGMTREVRDKALEPFFTTKPEGRGTGLGLAIVYGTVKAHRGRLDLQSEPGKGTTVRIELPARAPGLEDQRPPAAPPPPIEHRRLDLLLVDDDELIQVALQSLLETMGHAVTTVSSGEEALVKLEAGYWPDVIILDKNMPGLGGAGTLPEIRRILSGVPVLLATGRSDQQAKDLVDAYPGVTLLPKPFTLEQLHRHLQPLMRC